MSPFEREVKDLYRRHKRAAEHLENDNLRICSLELDIASFRLRARFHDDDPLLHLEAEQRIPGLDKPFKQRGIATRKYNENIERAATHKDKYFEEYVQLAQEDFARALRSKLLFQKVNVVAHQTKNFLCG